MPSVVESLNLSLVIKQDLQPRRFLFFGDGICHGNGWSIGARGVLEGEYPVVLDLGEQGDGLLEVGSVSPGNPTMISVVMLMGRVPP